MNDEAKPNDEAAPAPGPALSESPVDEPSPPASGVVREDEPEADDERVSAPPALPPKAALPVALAVTIALAFVLRFAFNSEQAGTWTMLIVLFAAYLPLAVLALVLIQKEGKIQAEVTPRGGDLTFGAFAAALMYGAAMAGRQLFLGVDSPRNWWVARIYLQLGDLSGNRMLYVGGAVLVIAVLEEIVWRGLVMRSLRRVLGPLRAWVLSSVLYAVAHVATIQLLAHPVAGPNPLLVAASLGCGLVWGHLYNRTGRLTPCLFAHGLFSWAIVDFPLWRM
jgi:membrane protease YdiL (CAAX protease family)